MKTFLVPALLLGLVGVAAAIASGSAPSASGAAECHKAAMGGKGVCPMTASECEDVMGGGCPESAAERCAEAAKERDCAEKCEGEQGPDCCKKKKEMECGECPKTAEPVEKP